MQNVILLYMFCLVVENLGWHYYANTFKFKFQWHSVLLQCNQNKKDLLTDLITNNGKHTFFLNSGLDMEKSIQFQGK